jgi:actin-related protein
MTGPDSLLNQPVVIDNGSGMIKAGFAGEDIPKCSFSSFVGRPKHTRVLAGALEGDLFIGNRAQELRGLLKIKYPLEHGIITDWDDMEKIWEFIYNEELKTLPEEVSGVVFYLWDAVLWNETTEKSLGGRVAPRAVDRSAVKPSNKP